MTDKATSVPTIHECLAPLDVETPMGRGSIWLVKEYGIETDTYYSVIIKEGELQGSIFDFSNKDIKVMQNYSAGRGKWTELKSNLLKKQGTEKETEENSSQYL